MVLDYGGMNKTVGTVWLHLCGFLDSDGHMECTCDQLDGVTIADNFVPWGETMCLVPPDVNNWEMPSDSCPQVCKLVFHDIRFFRQLNPEP